MSIERQTRKNSDLQFTDGLCAQELSIAYGSSVVVQNVCLAVRSGSVLALVGANGSGKTTLLRGLGGVEELFGGKCIAGRVICDGHQVVARTKAVPENIVFCPNGGRVFDDLTVEENLLATAMIGGNTVPSIELEHAVRKLSLHNIDRHRRARQLSGGERQLVALGRTILSGAKYLLLDEPTGSLSPSAKLCLMDFLMEIVHTQSRCIVLSEHDIAWADRVSDEIAVLRSGQIESCYPKSDNRYGVVTGLFPGQKARPPLMEDGNW